MQTVKESGMAVATFQTDYDDEVEFAARRWLVNRGREAAAGNGTPFCMVASFIHPHDPYVAKPEFWNLYEDADIDMPEFTLAPEDQDPFSRRVMDGIEASYIPLTEEEVRRRAVPIWRMSAISTARSAPLSRPCATLANWTTQLSSSPQIMWTCWGNVGCGTK